MPKVTVVIAVLNAESYIDKVVQCLLDQTYTNWDAVFVISDKTYDSTESKIRSIDDDRFSHIIYRDTGALGGSKNVGLDNADGKFVWFLDSDDIPSKTYLQKAVSIATRYGAQVSACNFVYKHENDDFEIPPGDFRVRVMDSEEAILARASEQFPVSSWSMLYDMDMIRRNGLRFSEGISEDILFTYRCLKAADVVCYNEEPLYTYVVREGSICNIKSDDRGISELEQYFKVREVIKPEPDSVLDRKIIQCMMRSMGHLTSEGFMKMSRSKEIRSLIDSSGDNHVRFEGSVIKYMPFAYCFAIHTFLRFYYYRTGRFFTHFRR